jgi:hypothetical protein
MPRDIVQRMFTRKLARSSNQSFRRGVFPVVHSWGGKFLKHVHNLFTHALWSSSPAGLRLEISYESDKKKMNLIFNYGKKFFLTGKMKRACQCENRNSVSTKIRATQTATIQNRRGEQTSSLIACASRVDRIGLCAKFPASASGGQALSKL